MVVRSSKAGNGDGSITGSLASSVFKAVKVGNYEGLLMADYSRIVTEENPLNNGSLTMEAVEGIRRQFNQIASFLSRLGSSCVGVHNTIVNKKTSCVSGNGGVEKGQKVLPKNVDEEKQSWASNF